MESRPRAVDNLFKRIYKWKTQTNLPQSSCLFCKDITQKLNDISLHRKTETNDGAESFFLEGTSHHRQGEEWEGRVYIIRPISLLKQQRAKQGENLGRQNSL